MAPGKRKQCIVLDDSDDDYNPGSDDNIDESTSKKEDDIRARKGVKLSTPPPERTVPSSKGPATVNSQSQNSHPSTTKSGTVALRAQPAPQATARTQPTTSLPTPTSTPAKPRELYDIPELADRCVPKTSTLEQVEYTNPQIFSLDPPYWKKWTAGNYRTFAEHLRQFFDPVMFAQKSGRPVEEVKHMYNCLLLNPLYDAEQACKRGEEGMEEVFALYRKSRAVYRPWGLKVEKGKEVSRFFGKLHGIKVGWVQIESRESGDKQQLALSELTFADKKYLEQTLTAEDKKKMIPNDTAENDKAKEDSIKGRAVSK